jgi:K+-sensing histidine kinase KdpD
MEAAVSFSGSVETGLRVKHLERRNHWMWALNIVLLFLLSLTVAFLYLLKSSGELPNWLPAPGGEIVLVVGLCGLTLLFCLYMLYKQIELSKVRKELLDLRLREESVRSRLAGITSLFDASSQLTELLELTPVLETVTLKVRSCMEADHASIHLLDPETGWLSCPVACGLEAEAALASREPRETGLVGFVMKTGEPVFLSGEQITSEGYGKGERGLVSVLAVPISTAEEILGVLKLGRAEPCEHFVASDAQALTTFAGHVAKTIRGIEEVSSLDNKAGRMHQANLQLVRTGVDRERLLGLMQSESTRPISRVARCAEILTSGSKPLSPERRIDLGRILTEQTVDLTRLVDDVCELLRLQAPGEDRERARVDLNELAQDSLRKLESEAVRKGIHVELDLDPDLPATDPAEEGIARVVESLIMAGVTICDSGNTLWITTNRDIDSIEFSVMCSGAMVDPEICDKLFELPDPRTASGTQRVERLRIPLHLSRRVVERHGGRIQAEDAAGKAIRLRLHLPYDPSISWLGESVEELQASLGRVPHSPQPIGDREDPEQNPPREQLSA